MRRFYTQRISMGSLFYEKTGYDNIERDPKIVQPDYAW